MADHPADQPKEQTPGASAQTPPADTGRDLKAERLAEALRANLKRRKAADRARAGRTEAGTSEGDD
jgi:hypothetical protein